MRPWSNMTDILIRRHQGCSYTEKWLCEDPEGGCVGTHKSGLRRNQTGHTLEVPASRTVRKSSSLLFKPLGLWHCAVTACAVQYRQVFPYQPQVPSANGDHHRPYLKGLVWGLNEIMPIKCCASIWDQKRGGLHTCEVLILVIQLVNLKYA